MGADEQPEAPRKPRGRGGVRHAKIALRKRKRQEAKAAKLNGQPAAAAVNKESGDALDDGFGDLDGTHAGAGAGEAQPKKKRRRPRGGAAALEFEASRRLAAEIADCPAAEQADWLWSCYAKAGGGSDGGDGGDAAAPREGLSAAAMAPLPAGPTLEARLSALEPAWAREFCGRGRKAPNGAPSLLVVSPAAVECCRVIRALPAFNAAARVAKLFAKHIKVAEQEALLGGAPVCVAAGTPGRLLKLLDSGALRLDALRYVALDLSLDAKQRSLLDMPETRGDWWAAFSRHVRPRVVGGRCRLVLLSLPPAGEGGHVRARVGV